MMRRGVLDLVVTVDGAEPAANVLRDFENEVFMSMGYGPSHHYDDPRLTSKFIAGFVEGELRGVVRLVSGQLSELPFFNAFSESLMPNFDAFLADGVVLNEIASLSVASSARAGMVAFDLIRHIHATGRTSAVTHYAWAIEPDRATKLERRFGIRTTCVSTSRMYMGGVCAVYVVEVANARRAVTSATDAWFNEPFVIATVGET